jgi:hypothetical protein
MRRSVLALLLLSICGLAAPVARASCGSSSCPIDLHALGFADDARFVFDVSFQYINQNRLRHAKGDFENEHDELRTINRITTLQLTSVITPRFQFSIVAPYVSRTHEHVDRASGEEERWRFGAFGDASVQGRYRVFRALWLSAAVKLPTGAKHEMSLGPAPEEAEVTIQPGSGSTDVVVGATYQGGIIRDTALGGRRSPNIHRSSARVVTPGSNRVRAAPANCGSAIGSAMPMRGGTSSCRGPRTTSIGPLSASSAMCSGPLPCTSARIRPWNRDVERAHGSVGKARREGLALLHRQRAGDPQRMRKRHDGHRLVLTMLTCVDERSVGFEVGVLGLDARDGKPGDRGAIKRAS